MNKIALLLLAVFVTVALLSAASSKTLVTGTIYKMIDGDPTVKVPGANVSVICDGVEKNTTSLSGNGKDGVYFVIYNASEEACLDGSFVEVTAKKDGLTGYNNGTIIGGVIVCEEGCDINLGEVDVWLVIPEFGLIAGLVTILGAVAVFFYVRRR